MPVLQVETPIFNAPQGPSPGFRAPIMGGDAFLQSSHSQPTKEVSKKRDEEMFDDTFTDLFDPSSPTIKADTYSDKLFSPPSPSFDLLQDPRFLPTSSLDSFWAAALSGNFEQQLLKKKQEEAEKKKKQEEAENKKKQEELLQQQLQLQHQMQQLQQQQQQQLQQQQQPQQQQQQKTFYLAPQSMQMGQPGQPTFLLPNQLYQLITPDGKQQIVMAQMPLMSSLQPPVPEKKEAAPHKPRKTPLTEADGKNELKKSFFPRIKKRRGRKRKYVQQNAEPLTYEDEVVLGIYTRRERWMKIQRYRSKRATRCFNKKILYACRKSFADKRPRVGGRFVKLEEGTGEK